MIWKKIKQEGKNTSVINFNCSVLASMQENILYMERVQK